MTVLDYFVILVVGISIVFGLARGIIKASVTLVACILGLLAAGKLYAPVGAALESVVSSRVAAQFLGFVLVFFGVLVAGMVVSRLLRRAAKRVRLGWIDHLVGGGFGLVRGWLICSVVYLALTAFPIRLEAVEQAKLTPLLLEGTRVIAYLTSAEVRQRFQDGYWIVAGTRTGFSKGKQE